MNSNPQQPKVPKDLGLKVAVSKEEAAWIAIRNSQEETIRNGKITIEVAETVLSLAILKIKLEKEKFK